jgi:spore coat polysaccharide biosynthesis protein SpsF (cytidylyltransferase family)
MIVSIFKKEKLIQSLKFQKKYKKKDLAEHPTLYFYRDGKKKIRSINLQMPKKWTILPIARLTLDTQEDYLLLSKIYDDFIICCKLSYSPSYVIAIIFRF